MNSVARSRPIVVQKYGGSSVADLSRLETVAKRVIETVKAGNCVVVVVSAMGQTTNQLQDLAKQLSRAPDRRELDMLLSAGERIASSLLAIALENAGYPAISFTGSQCGIITDDRHNDARIIEVRPYRVQDELDLGKIVVIAGYQGVSYKRDVTTLGRGGSDTTAVAMAAALNADYCEICSDVDGVYSADPNVVATARHLPTIGYAEMQELAYAGAKVLNAQAVDYARTHNIRIVARATSGSERHTEISPTAESVTPLVAVTHRDGLLEVRCNGGFDRVQAFFRAIEGLDGNMLWSTVDSTGGVIYLHSAMPGFEQRVRTTIDKLNRVKIHGPWSSVTLIGRALSNDMKIVNRCLALAETQGIRPHCFHVRPLALTLVIKPEAKVKELMTMFHQQLIETSR